MAHLPRVGKPPPEWNQRDLRAYNIHVHPQPQSVFFNGLRCSGGVLPSLPPTSPLHPFLTPPVYTPNLDTILPRSTILALLNLYSPIQFNDELDGKVDNFVASLIKSMGPPYSASEVMGINPSTRLTFQNCGKTYPTYADFCTYSNYVATEMMNLVITQERFVGLDVHYDSEEDKVDTKDFDLQDWIHKPLACWPRDDAEAKLIATSIATYGFNNYEVPKLYYEDADDVGLDEDPCFIVQDPMFLPGIVWKGTRPSFYKLSIGSDLVDAVRVGKYPHVPTRIYKYTPILPEEPEGGMDELGVNAMKPLANRKVVIGCLEGFKMFLRVKRFGRPISYPY
jgi:hypothetical protein